MDVLSSSSRNSSMEVFNFNLTQAVLILEEHKSDYLFEGYRKTAVMSGYICLVVTGICTNLVVSMAILCNSRLRVARNLLIVNLSISDLMLCIFCMPFTLIELLSRTYVMGAFLCRCVPFVQGVTIFLSSATVSAIAVDRQRGIIHCSGHRKQSRKGNCRKMIFYTTSLWAFSVIMALPILFSKSMTTVSLAGMVLYQKCIEQWPSIYTKACYTIMILCAQFAAPSVVLTMTHIKIKSYLNTRVKKHDATNSPRTSERLKKELRRNSRATAVLCFISIAFACSWLPWNAFNLMADFDFLSSLPPNDFYLAFVVCHLVAMTSSVTNPILYGWFNTNVRREIRQFRIATIHNVFGRIGSKPSKSDRSNGSGIIGQTYLRSPTKPEPLESRI